MSDPARQLEDFLQRVPYVRFLGMRAELAGDEMTAILPFSQHLIGNVMLPALHGGVIGAFLETTALAQLSVAQAASPGGQKIAKTIDVTIEYLRPGRPLTTYARADLRKVGRRIANVHVEAWQEARSHPIAFLRGHFLLAGE
ncbi:PaaI family thioesterase [Phenylobacterium soli]|uniref:PaaI family thioesterase n=1 Tax=Phenylobacterium soli TaxID=2170551 RepID=A0A328AFT3_9CAUL|nr:PaaI family thioesterase [Phenylobacterium soli]RAK53395.1 PaaI family thioesterase [Phenylobacterium soli]